MQSTLLFVFVLVSLLQAVVARPQLADIVETATDDGRFKILVTALAAGDLVVPLEGPGPFTVFAPTDDAFAKLPPGTITELLKPERKRELVNILTYHVVGGKAITAADIIAMRPPFKLAMLNNIATNITKDGAKIKINNSTVIQADIMASNGIIHAIDTVLLPRDIVDTAVSDGRFKTLVIALTAAGLVPTLKSNGPFTVFAPTDAAFAKLPPGTIDDLLKPENKQRLIKILTYHVIGGKALKAADLLAMNPPFQLQMLDNFSTTISEDAFNLKINDASVIQADIQTLNGVIHAIDTVLLPPDIVDIAVSDGRFKTLVVALTAAGLVTTLKGDGPFTVFAPTDDAFAKLPPGTIDDLLKPENKPKLINILTYHVVGGRAITSADIFKKFPPFQLEMLNGLATTITLDGITVKINDASIVKFDVMALNGIIHVIDTVLLPSD
jgi:transforming growth factor-beta-induced protein